MRTSRRTAAVIVIVFSCASHAWASRGDWVIDARDARIASHVHLDSVRIDTLYVSGDSIRGSLAIGIADIDRLVRDKPNTVGLFVAVGGGIGLLAGLAESATGGGGHPDFSSAAPLAGFLGLGLVGGIIGILASIDEKINVGALPYTERVQLLDTIITDEARRR